MREGNHTKQVIISPISDPMLQEKVVYFCKMVKENANFSSHTTWLNILKNVKRLPDEYLRRKAFRYFETENEFYIELNNLMVIENLTECIFYNCGERRLNFTRPPIKSLFSTNNVMCNKICYGFK